MIVLENINNSKTGNIKYLEFISHILKFTLSVGYLLAHEIAYEIKFFLNGKFRNFHKNFLIGQILLLKFPGILLKAIEK